MVLAIYLSWIWLGLEAKMFFQAGSMKIRENTGKFSTVIGEPGGFMRI